MCNLITPSVLQLHLYNIKYLGTNQKYPDCQGNLIIQANLNTKTYKWLLWDLSKVSLCSTVYITSIYIPVCVINDTINSVVETM